MSRNAAVALSVFAAVSSIACAARPKLAQRQMVDVGPYVMESTPTRMYIGHSVNGDVVVAASHYDAMNGLAVASTDLGLKDTNGGKEDLECRRETPTGSHVPRWVCRYQDDIEAERRETQDSLAATRLGFSRRSVAATSTGAKTFSQ